MQTVKSIHVAPSTDTAQQARQPDSSLFTRGSANGSTARLRHLLRHGGAMWIVQMDADEV